MQHQVQDHPGMLKISTLKQNAVIPLANFNSFRTSSVPRIVLPSTTFQFSKNTSREKQKDSMMVSDSNTEETNQDKYIDEIYKNSVAEEVVYSLLIDETFTHTRLYEKAA